MTDPDLNLKPRLERLGDRVQPRTDAFDRLDRLRARRARSRRLGTIALAFVVAIAGTWGAFAAFRTTGAQPADDPTPVVDSPCAAPQSATLDLVVNSGFVLNSACWNVPADTPLTINFDNRDSQGPAILIVEPGCPGQSSSDFLILGCEPPPTAVFTSALLDGTRATLLTPPLEAGVYQLYDQIHPASARATLYVGPGPFPSPGPDATSSAVPDALENCDGPPIANAQIRFSDLAWDVVCWKAPAGEPLTMTYLNRSDGVVSGLAIVGADTCRASVVLGNATNCTHQDSLSFDGSLETGPSASTYEIGTLPAGTYVMYDPVHPISAHATLIVD